MIVESKAKLAAASVAQLFLVRPMERVASVAALFVTFGLVAAYASPPTYDRSQIDGLYVIPEEVRGYQNDRLELALRE